MFFKQKTKSNPAKGININYTSIDIEKSIKNYVVWQTRAMDLYYYVYVEK